MCKLLFIIFLIVVHSPLHTMEQVAKKQKICSELVWGFGRAVRHSLWQFYSLPPLNAKLLYATQENDPQAITALLGQGAQIESIALRSETPLEFALLNSYWQSVRCLMEHGATLPRKQYLYDAIQGTKNPCPLPLQQELVHCYFKPTGSNLRLAVQKRYKKLIHLLLEHGADPNWQNKQGVTVIWYTSASDIIRILRRHGARLDLQTKLTGVTVLHNISRSGKVPLVTAPYLEVEPYTKSELVTTPPRVFALLCSLKRLEVQHNLQFPQGIKSQILKTCFGQKLYFAPLGKLLRTVSKSELIKKMPFELQQRLVHQNIISSTEALIKLHVACHLAQLQHDFSILDRHGKQAWQYGERLELCPEVESLKKHWHAKVTQEYESLFAEGDNV